MESDPNYQDSVKLGLLRTNELTKEPFTHYEQWAYIQGREDEARWCQDRELARFQRLRRVAVWLVLLGYVVGIGLGIALAIIARLC